jgi:hypothetical protein
MFGVLFLPNDLLTAGCNQTARHSRVNVSCARAPLFPTCNHSRTVLLVRAHTRAGPTCQVTVQTLGFAPARFPFPFLSFLSRVLPVSSHSGDFEVILHSPGAAADTPTADGDRAVTKQRSPHGG